MITYKATLCCLALAAFSTAFLTGTKARSNPTPVTVEKVSSKDFIFTMSADKQQYTVGDDVTLRLTLANLSKQEVVYPAGSHLYENFNVKVRLPDGTQKETGWRRMGNQGLVFGHLKPGATKTIIVPLKGFLETAQVGTYAVSATATLLLKEGEEKFILPSSLSITAAQ